MVTVSDRSQKYPVNATVYCLLNELEDLTSHVRWRLVVNGVIEEWSVEPSFYLQCSRLHCESEFVVRTNIEVIELDGLRETFEPKTSLGTLKQERQVVQLNGTK